MNILWISHLLPYPAVGGVQIRSYHLLKELCKTNKVHFVGLYQSVHQPNAEILETGLATLEACCASVTVHPFESFTGKISLTWLALRSALSRRSYKEMWASSRKLSASIRALVAEQRFDLVHFDTISLLPYALLLPDDLPRVINHHNIESTMLLRRSENQRNPLVRSFFRQEAAKILKLEKGYCPTGVNLVVSTLDQKRLQRIVPNCHSEIIPNGVDLSSFSRLNEPYMDKSLLWVGGLTWYPNLEAVRYILREIWPRLVEIVPDARLLIVGRQPPEDMRRETEQFEGVELLGFVDDIRPLMSRVSGFLCPIRDGGGTRLKVLNAMAMGVPLLATSMACEGVPVTDGSDVLLAESPEDFVGQAERLFQDAGLRSKISMNARRLIEEQFDFAVIGKKLDDVCRRAVSDPGD